jgi:hypothetical protein
MGQVKDLIEQTTQNQRHHSTLPSLSRAADTFLTSAHNELPPPYSSQSAPPLSATKRRGGIDRSGSYESPTSAASVVRDRRTAPMPGVKSSSEPRDSIAVPELPKIRSAFTHEIPKPLQHESRRLVTPTRGKAGMSAYRDVVATASAAPLLEGQRYPHCRSAVFAPSYPVRMSDDPFPGSHLSLRHVLGYPHGESSSVSNGAVICGHNLLCLRGNRIAYSALWSYCLWKAV